MLLVIIVLAFKYSNIKCLLLIIYQSFIMYGTI